MQLFFAISGFLVTWRIVEDERKRGRFLPRDFYIRRLFRIQPAALTYLAAVALLAAAGIYHLAWGHWFGALFLYNNYLFHGLNVPLRIAGAPVDHFWSLSVEEHFYILLATFFLLVKRHRDGALAGSLILLLVLQHVLRASLYSLDVSERRTPWQIQFLVLAALCSLLMRREPVRIAVQRYLHPWVAFASTGLCLLLMTFRLHHTHPSLFTIFIASNALIACTFNLWILATTFHPQSLVSRFLELRPIRYLGRISYSLYLWHVIFFLPQYADIGVTWPPLVFLSGRPWRYLASLAAAALSYHFIEKPFIRLGHRIAPPATAGHADLQPVRVPSLG